MKNTKLIFLPLLLSLTMSLPACGKKNNNSSSNSEEEEIVETPDGHVDVLPENNEGNIIQCFNWKYSDIKDNLSGFANSGFKAIQTSPVQQPKSGGPNWMSFYQPVSFAIGTNSPLGTKQELKELCEEAEEYGIAIICDIVFNHMANVADKVLEEDGTPVVCPEVNNFEPEIYAQRNDSTNPTFHHNKSATGSGAITQYYAYGDLPDLNTANPLVQQRALALLKECIDVGVDGFRFDAAKHIETPTDPQYASDFWPNVLGAAKTYYKNKTQKDLIAYGEILNDVDGGRKISDYTAYMKVTDNAYIADIASASVKGDATKAAAAKYSKKTDASNLVTWVESHDTYVVASTHVSNKKTARQYAIIASRKDSVAMYLARPSDTFEVAVAADYFYEHEEVAIANRFHNRFIGCNEEQTAQGPVYVNERYDDKQAGAILVNLKGSGENELTFSHLGTGVYYDQRTGEKITVKDNKATVTFDDTGIIVLTKSKHELRPTIAFNNRNISFNGSLGVKVTVNNATKASYKINGGAKVSFTNQKTITIGDVVDGNNMVHLDFEVENDEFKIERHLHFKKITLIPGGFNVVNLKPSYLTNYDLYIWSWTTSSIYSQDYTWNEEHQVLLINNASNYTGFLLVIFEKGYVIPSMTTWDNNLVKQTGNIDPSASFYDASNF